MNREVWKNIVFVILLILTGLIYVILDRGRLMDLFRNTLPADEAGLFMGIFFGDKSGLTKYWYEIFKKAGVLHIVVASGANLGFVASLAIGGLAGVVGRKRAIVLGMMLVSLYVTIVGFEAPISRALIIFFLYFWAQILGRRFDLMRAVVLMLLVLLIVDITVFAKVGFWMSLVAFLAIVSFSGIKIKTKNRRWINLVLLNIWINLWIWPITGYVFGQINWLSILVNPLVFFGVEAMFGLGILVVFVSLFAPTIATGLLMIGLPFLSYFLGICKLFAGMGMGVINVDFNLMMGLGWYLILFWFLATRTRG